MTEPNTSTIDVANFISDMRAAIDKHIEDAGRVVNRLNKPQGEISPVTDSDKLWAAILVFHTALVDWGLAQEIRDSKKNMSAVIDVGLRMYLDNVRDQFIAAATAKEPKRTILHRQ